MSKEYKIEITVANEKSLIMLREMLKQKGIFTCDKPLKWRWKHLSWKEKFEAKQRIKQKLHETAN